MYYELDWQLTIGNYQLAFFDGVEIHKSVDLLADTCIITLPLYAHKRVINLENDIPELKVRRGNKVVVNLGYNGELREEFSGYLLTPLTDEALVLECEDELFLMRKTVPNIEFKNTGVKTIAQYLVDKTGTALTVNCTIGITYEKFVINAATAYDVLKKLQEETKANIYLRNGVLNIHPPYTEKHGAVRYSFQQNIESSTLKYKLEEDRKMQIVVEATGKDGKKREVTAGNTGGDKITIKGAGLSEASMKELADAEFRRQVYDGYDGDITGWLIPFVQPGDSVELADEDFPYKKSWYYCKSVTTTFNSSGAVRKIQLGIKLAA